MMASGHHSLEPRGPPSPGNASGSSNVAKFSLLGQQFTHYNSSQHHQSPSSSHSSTLAFSVGAHLQQGAHPPQQPSSSQSHPQAHTQQQSPLSHPQSQPGGNRVPTTSGYDNLHHAFPFSGGQGYGAGYGSQGLQDGNVGGLMKMSPPDGPAFSTTSAQALLNALSALQQKIQQLQAVVQMMVQGGGQSAAQQQSVATGVASAISQLVMATAAILQQPSVPAAQSIAADLQLNHLFDGAAVSGLQHFQQNGIANIFGSFQGSTHGNTFANFGNSAGGVASFSGGVGGSGSLGGGIGGSGLGGSGMGVQSLGGQGLGSPSGNYRSSLPSSAVNSLGNSFDMGGGTNADLNSGAGVGGSVGNLMVHGSGALQGSMDDQDPGAAMKDEDDDGEGENLPPGSYELVEMEAIEILAEHTHFCEICGKGFKRDANLRMHMRGHGDEYKTPAALARPDRPSLDPSAVRPRRYSCPYEGCKRNKKHRKFQPLKTMLCVKNHYRRSHCPKIFTCNKCKTKKFSVVADLKTHEKHCGRDKWQCSCGTTFSRKDKLLGHIGLFAGHTPAWPLQEMEGTGGALEAGMSGSGGFNSGSGAGKGNESVFLGAAGSNNFGHGNSSAMVAALGGGNGSVMDVGKGANVGVGVVGSIGRSGLQNLGPRACSLSLSDESTGQSLGDGSSSSALAGSLVPGSSMLHGLLSSSFLQQTNANNETSDVLQ